MLKPCKSVKDMLYTHNLLKEFITIATPITMHIDNTGAINLSEKNLNNQRTKHIDIRYHHIRDWVQSKVVKIEKVRSIDNIADLFTKPLPARLHEHHSATFVREFKINLSTISASPSFS
uniref:Copia protein n=1 Tax=Pyramimonas obovata TaxID=1411642 RepID=A0A7S0QV68_9CHLO|mmetsp:Transcript_13160/g.27893  ORF Transcript_13160/g.27893 Transcript_13160/m.27893 type:complete len:119 (+) Transcript_13160:87-443(+)